MPEFCDLYFLIKSSGRSCPEQTQMVLIFTFELESQFHQVKLKKNKNILLILYNKHTQYESGTKPDKDGMRKRVGPIHKPFIFCLMI